jgi:hypothetical protein
MGRLTLLRPLLLALCLLSACSPRASGAVPPGEWNDGPITWTPWEKAVATAQSEHKPICLVFFTGWCPHCKSFKKEFFDARVVEKSHSLVMVRVDEDHSGEMGNRYALDGHYIPRTYFLSSSGAVEASIAAHGGRYKYFYDESDPAGLLASMQQAVNTLH